MAITVNTRFDDPHHDRLQHRHVRVGTRHAAQDLRREIEEHVDAGDLLQHGQHDADHQRHTHAGCEQLPDGLVLVAARHP